MGFSGEGEYSSHSRHFLEPLFRNLIILGNFRLKHRNFQNFDFWRGRGYHKHVIISFSSMDTSTVNKKLKKIHIYFGQSGLQVF